jgi:membrane protease YdiL (CAAX protease family)
MELNGFDHFIFFVICILLPGMSLLSAKVGDVPNIEPDLPPKKHIYFSNGLLLWIGALLVLTNWNLTQKSWELLGVRMPINSSIVVYLCLALIIIYAADSIYTVIKGKEESGTTTVMDQILPVNWGEYAQFTFLAISAGICEEIVFRGFLVNYFLEITKTHSFGPYLAILIPAIVFSISHLYQGWFNVIKIFSLALLFCAIFLFSQSLLLVIIIHVAVDLISGALVVLLAQKENASINE